MESFNEIALDKCVYYPGDKLEGVIYCVRLPAQGGFEVKGVRIVVEGIESVLDTKRDVAIDRTIFKHEETLVTFSVGRVELPLIFFSFNVPRGIPPTYQQDTAGVSVSTRYTVTSIVKLARRSSSVKGSTKSVQPSPKNTLEFLVDSDTSGCPKWSPKPYSVSHRFSSHDRGTGLFSCCIPPATKDCIDVTCTLDKEYYRGANSRAINFSVSTSTEVEYSQASIVRAIHYKSHKNGEEDIRDIETICDSQILSQDGSCSTLFILPENFQPIPWIVSTLFRSMYYIKIEIMKDANLHRLLVPIFLLHEKPLQYRFSSGDQTYPLRTCETWIHETFPKSIYKQIELTASAEPNFKYLCKLGNLDGKVLDRFVFSRHGENWQSAAEDAAYKFAHISSMAN